MSERAAPLVDHSELGGPDAVETAEGIRAGRWKAEEVVSAAIDRARRFGEELNAIPFDTYEAAMARAAEPREGPFSGVPTFVKALDDEAGVPNDQASRALAGRVARRTEPYVERLLSTGLVSLGHSAAPEIGLSATTEPLAHGPTRNPWSLDHSTGGSSGGAAALVAARVVPLAHGSDAGGSIRIPSSSCGLVGLKPSRQRGFATAQANLLPVRIFTYGALTRSVRDSANYVAELEARTPARGARRLGPIGLVEGAAAERLRIGLYTDSPLGHDVDAEVREATLAAGERCRELGHRVEEIACPYEGSVLDDFWIYLGFIAQAVFVQTRAARLGRLDADGFEPWTRGLASLFRSQWRRLPGIVRRLHAQRHVSAELYDRYDVLLCPTLSGPPPRIGDIAPDRPFEEVVIRQKQHICFTPIQNVTGEPAISLPLAVNRAGLPIGVQAAAAPGGEASLLALAFELEPAFQRLD